MTITVDVDLLPQHRLALLAEADEIERASILDPPDAGALSSVTTDALERLSHRAQQLAGHARELADAQAQPEEGAYGGLSGIVYRSSSTMVEHACGQTGRCSRRLAEGLAAYARGMTDVGRRLDEAVALAAPHVRVTGGRVFSPLRPAGPDGPATALGWAAWQDSVERWRAARDLEDQVSQEWVRVLDRPVLFEGAER